MNRPVRFQDVDAAGILFFARAFEYFHDAYVALLDAHGIDLAKILASGTWGAPLASAEAAFKAPLRFGDRVAVEIERADVGTTSITVLFRVLSEPDGARVFCTGKTVHVFIDRKTFRTIPVPDDVRAVFTGG